MFSFSTSLPYLHSKEVCFANINKYYIVKNAQLAGKTVFQPAGELFNVGTQYRLIAEGNLHGRQKMIGPVEECWGIDTLHKKK